MITHPTETPTMTENQIIIDLLIAKRKAEEAINISDNAGTCNFDHPTVKVAKEHTASFIAAAQSLGFRCHPMTSTGWKDRLDLSGVPGARYQGAARTAGAEAFASALAECGYDTRVFYMMD